MQLVDLNKKIKHYDIIFGLAFLIYLLFEIKLPSAVVSKYIANNKMVQLVLYFISFVVLYYFPFVGFLSIFFVFVLIGRTQNQYNFENDLLPEYDSNYLGPNNQFEKSLEEEIVDKMAPIPTDYSNPSYQPVLDSNIPYELV